MLSTLRLAQLVVEAGFPPGVFNVVTGYGETVGAALVKHPLVHKVRHLVIHRTDTRAASSLLQAFSCTDRQVSYHAHILFASKHKWNYIVRNVLLYGVQIGFTGSTAVGKEILAVASSTMKSTSLECGGKNPLIICADANIDEVCSETIRGLQLVCSCNCLVCFRTCQLHRKSKTCSNATRMQGCVRCPCACWPVWCSLSYTWQLVIECAPWHVQRPKPSCTGCYDGAGSRNLSFCCLYQCWAILHSSIPPFCACGHL